MIDLVEGTGAPGSNGLVAKLNEISARVADAVNAFRDGLIDEVTLTGELTEALDQLGAFDNQLAAKIRNRQIVEPEASQLVETSSTLGSLIWDLMAS